MDFIRELIKLSNIACQVELFWTLNDIFHGGCSAVSSVDFPFEFASSFNSVVMMKINDAVDLSI